MPVTKQAIKKVRQDRRKTVFNIRAKKNLKKAIGEFKKNPSTSGLKVVYKLADRASKIKLIHDNKAARIKSRLIKLVPSAKKTSPKSKT